MTSLTGSRPGSADAGGMDVVAVAAAVAAQLRTLADPVRALRERRYLKSDLVHLGVPMPVLRKIAVLAVREARSAHDDMLALVDELWTAAEDGTPIHEMRVAALPPPERGD